MAKMDKEFLMKHHFWVLLLPFVLFALVAWIGLMTEVSGAANDKLEKIDAHRKQLEGVKAQPKKLIDLYQKQVGELVSAKTKMWEKAWASQAAIYTWPENYIDEQKAYLSKLRFGDVIDDNVIRQQFRSDDKYRYEYEQLAKSVEPMQFNGGWEAILRHVPKWGLVPTSEEIWLALEDYWVQRELLTSLNQVNVDAARFKPVSGDRKEEDSPLRRKFESRLWEVELWVENEAKGDGRVIKGTIKNRTERLQALGIENRMILHVWLDADPDSDPIEFPVEGEFLAGGKSEPIRGVPEHKLDRAVRVTEIARVEQVFDGRTVPVKRIETVALSYASDRHASTQQLKMTTFSDKEYQASGGGAAATGSDPSGMGLIMPMAGVGSGEGRGGAGALGGAGTGNDPTVTANGLVRKRYIDKTDQVRRMSVGLMVVADQDFLQDVLVAMANSRLRFQNTQFHWNRFRGQIVYNDPNGSPTPVAPGPGSPEGGRPPFAGSKKGGGSPDDGVPIRPGPGSFPRGPMTPTTPVGGTGGEQTRSQDQLSAALVEVSVYGIASLYEPFKGDPSAAAPVKTATPKAPARKPVAKKTQPARTTDPATKESGKTTDPSKKEPDKAAEPMKKASPPPPPGGDATPGSKEKAPTPKEADPKSKM